jgi:PIN domain nuclease of toxin-antitoxin system
MIANQSNSNPSTVNKINTNSKSRSDINISAISPYSITTNPQNNISIEPKFFNYFRKNFFNELISFLQV